MIIINYKQKNVLKKIRKYIININKILCHLFIISRTNNFISKINTIFLRNNFIHKIILIISIDFL